MPLVFGRSIFGFAVVSLPPVSDWTDPDLTNASYDSVSFSIASQETAPNNIGFNDDGTSMYIIGSVTDAIYQYTLSTAWDLSTASYASKSLSTSGETTPRDFTFNNDGTKIYYVGSTSDTIYQYSLSTAYDISTATSDSKTTSVGSQAGTPTGIQLKSDGTKLYVCDGGTDTIYQYSLSTAFDISTASYDSVSFSFSSEGTNTQSIFFSPDGTSLFVCDTTSSNNSVYKYSLSTAWDVSTLSYANESFSLAGQDDPFGVAFKSDGSKMYMVGVTSDAVYQYSTAAPVVTWTDPDLTNASYDSVSFSVASQDINANGFVFGDDGTKAYMSGNNTDTVYQYTLTTAYDISTASYASKSFSVNSQETNLRTARFSPDGGSMYIIGNTNRVVYQYTLSTNWDVSTASYAGKSMSAATQSSYATGFVFNNDGTKIFVNSPSDDKVYEYLLTTAYDVSTGSYNNASISLTGAASNINPQEFAFNDDGTKMYVTCITNDNVYEFGLTTAFDISTASYSSISFDISSQADQAMDISFNSSGSKMFIMDAITDTVYQYSTAAPVVTWAADLANASYDNKSFDVASQQAVVEDVFFKDDGLSMYITGSNPDTIHQYTLSTAWDVSTASYANKSWVVGINESSPRTLQFKDDGTSVYIIGSGSDTVYQYYLTTAWDVSTASSTGMKSLSVNAQESNPRGLFFKSDGTKAYVVGASSDSVYQYGLSTAWDVSTGSYESKSFSVSTQTSEPNGVFFSPDGDEMYVIGNLYPNADVFKYTLSTAWDVSTASYSSLSFSTASEGFYPTDIFFKPDGTKLYVSEKNNDKIYQYSTAAAPAVTWTNPDFVNASYDSVFFDISSQEGLAQGLMFKPDGTKFYVIGSQSKVFEYELSTAWDITTASYNSNFLNVSSQGAGCTGLDFKTDGTQLYTINTAGDSVYMYNLSTAWDVTTGSYSNTSFSVASQDTVPTDVQFKNDGTEMYVVGAIGQDVIRYTLSTAWDISTASYTSNFVTTSQDAGPADVFFSPTGDKMYIIGPNEDEVNEYSLSTDWDITSASFDRNFSIASEEGQSRAFFFKSDGSKMYITGSSMIGTNGYIYQYST